MDGKVILTADEVAGYLGIHRETVYLYAKIGKLPAFKVGYNWRFRRQSIDSWVEDQEKQNLDRTR